MNSLQKYHNMKTKAETLNQLKAFRQPGQKNLTNLFYPTFYSDRYLHGLRPYCENVFETVCSSIREKWEVNLTIWHIIPRFNLWLFTISVKSKAPFRRHFDIAWPTWYGLLLHIHGMVSVCFIKNRIYIFLLAQILVKPG